MTHECLTPLKFPSSEGETVGFVFLLSDQEMDLPPSDGVKRWKLAHLQVNLFLEQGQLIWFFFNSKSNT